MRDRTVIGIVLTINESALFGKSLPVGITSGASRGSMAIAQRLEEALHWCLRMDNKMVWNGALPFQRQQGTNGRRLQDCGPRGIGKGTPEKAVKRGNSDMY